jgi:hypothetical protein
VGDVWPVVVPVVEFLVAGIEVLSAVRLWPHGPTSITATTPVVRSTTSSRGIGSFRVSIFSKIGQQK